MKIRNFFIIFFFLFLLKQISAADEIEIISKNIKILDKGNIIHSEDTEAILTNKKLFIKGNKSIYDKISQIIIFEENVNFSDKINNLNIKSEKATYNQKRDILYSTGLTNVNFQDKYLVTSKNLVYDREKKIIYSDYETVISDDENNIYNVEKNFILDLKKKIISSNKINVVDNKNNIYQFENAKIHLNKKEIVGKELRIDFEDGYFGNLDNDPKLKGKSAISNNKETKIYKTVFSTCNTQTKSCPSWEIKAEEFTHDKINKTFNYRNTWLKLFDKEILYFPYFSHPDPSVDRKSGFLVPSYGSSNNFGSWINIPYFKTFGSSKDMTFNPRLYADDKFLMQSEYRQAFSKSNLVSDFSYNNDGKNSNSHIFADLSGKIDQKTDFAISFQKVSNDNYLKIHNLSSSSSLITNDSLLTSQINYSKDIDKQTYFNTDFIIYEDLSKNKHDRFQYILPTFNFNKNIDLDENYNGNFQFETFGFQKNYDTNKYETLIVNDFLFNSDNFISNNGLVSNYNFLIKNFNSYTENSTQYKNKEEYEVFGKFLIKSYLPMKKSFENSNDYIKPTLSLRYSPNNTKDISNKDTRLSYENIFSLNRIGTNEIVEGGKSISYGIEYKKNDLNEGEIFEFSIANSISFRENKNLPIKSNLDKKRSDIVGKASFFPNSNINIDYIFSYDNNLKSSNYDSINLGIDTNLFSSNFSFTSEDEIANSTETISNTTTLNLNKENSLKLKVAKDLKKNFTEYRDLMYQYQNDCFIASVEYNNQYYSDGNLKPEKNIFLMLKFIPFAEFKQGSDIKQ